MDTKKGRTADQRGCTQINHCKSLDATVENLSASIYAARVSSPKTCRTIAKGRPINLHLNLSFWLRVHSRPFAVVSAFFLLLCALPAQADELPKFSEAKVNEFVSQYADFVNNYIEAYKAAKTGNPAAFNQLKTQVKQLQDEVAEVAEKLQSKPEEVQRYEQFITTYTEKMIDGTK
jgi:hypothetical protein